VSAPEAAFVSYRLGGNDGVGVEAGKWEWALRDLGFTTRRVAGELEGALRPDDTWIPSLAIDPAPGANPDPEALAAAISGADLVVVENICSLPLNLEAATMVRDVLVAHRGRVCFHHHDFAWERPHLEHVTGFPPDLPGALHITISDHARRGLADRGIDARTVPNSFTFDAEPGDRATTRRDLGIADDEVVLLPPTRAIPRKNIGGGLSFAGRIAGRLAPRPVRYWITGPAEDGFDREFAALVAAADVPVHIGRAPRSADAYAAADLVVFPSTWEGFGNPVVEAVAARRMVAVSSYPVLDEIRADLDLLSIDDPDRAAAWLAAPDDRVVERNLTRARDRFSIEHLPRRIAACFSEVGWDRW
jgi:glycosyltransferase involved in cell wall biosynthesis